MADLKAKLIRGDRFSAEDTLEIKLTYTGTAYSCEHYIESVSGVDVTHGGGASASTRLHYKSKDRDADGDGNIDYSSSEMKVVQAAKGTSVIKVCASVLLKKDYDAWATAHESWQEDNLVELELEDGSKIEVYKEDPEDAPSYPTGTVYKSGEITLEWSDDSFK